jgi:hypothetical protein
MTTVLEGTLKQSFFSMLTLLSKTIMSFGGLKTLVPPYYAPFNDNIAPKSTS